MTERPRDPGSSALLTDLYQLTMLQSYWERGMTAPAAFELFVRRLPPTRGFLVAAGLEQALDHLEQLSFAPDEIDWLARQPGFRADFLSWLARLRFTGDVDAIPEGTLFFPDEPILRVVAPLPEAQLVETRLLALLHFASLVASKASRCVLAAPGRHLVDFGLRRAHGAEAGLLAARACYLAGFAGSATALAGQRFGIPTFGTMAHSYVEAHDSELAAFLDFARGHAGTTLLIDTYDTERAAAKVAALVPRLRREGIELRGVRIDSGDLAHHARRVRRILDEGGCGHVQIFASGGLDEYALAELAEAPIDGFGVGTALVTSADLPSLDCAYKLQEYAGVARRKRSEGKATWPGRKQVFRRHRADGRLEHDALGLAGEALPGDALLRPVMRAGRRLAPSPGLAEVRAHAARQLASLPAELRALRVAGAGFRPEVTPALRALADEVDRRERAQAEADVPR